MIKNRTVLFVCVAAVLATIYVTFFTDWFKPKKIQINWRISAAVGGAAHGPNVVFYLNKAYPLTSVKVVETAELSTNKYPHALWYLVPVAEPALADTFNYGATIPGMKPEIPTALPESLQSDTSYSLLVEAGNIKGEKAFSWHDPQSQN